MSLSKLILKKKITKTPFLYFVISHNFWLKLDILDNIKIIYKIFKDTSKTHTQGKIQE